MRASWLGLLSLGIGIGIGAAACQPNPTVFRGEPQFAGGPRGCVAKCEADGLQMTGFVYSGEFATSCVCSPRPSPDQGAPSPPSPFGSASADEPSDADPLARRGPADSAAVAGAQAAVEGANSAQVAAEAAASAAEASRQQQQMLQRRKP